MSTTSGQFLTVPPLSHRSSHHHHHHHHHHHPRNDSSSSTRATATTRNVASSSRMKLEDTPLGMPVSPSSSGSLRPGAAPLRICSGSSSAGHTGTANFSSSSSSSSPSSSAPSSPTTQAVRRRLTVTRRGTVAVSASPPPSNILHATASNPTGSARSLSTSQQQQQQHQQHQFSQPPQHLQLSPRSIFRAMPFLLRLRSQPSDLLNMTCTSGEQPRTHAVLKRPPISINNKASQALIYDQTIMCEDAVNAEVLLRFARNELLERAQQTDRRVTALVDEEWRYTIRQTKNGDYNVQVFYSACPAQCESQNSNEPVDPRKPVALSHVTNIPGLMRVIQSE